MKRVAAASPQFSPLVCSPLAGRGQLPEQADPIVVPSLRADSTSGARNRTAHQHGLGQPVIVENPPAQRQRRRDTSPIAPDGYTILLSDVGALSINPSVYTNMPSTVKDFSPIVMVSYSPHVLACIPRCR